MKKIILLSGFILLNMVLSFAQDSTKISALVNQAKLNFDIVGNKPVGKGWDLLANQFASNNFVGWGEYHNSPMISILTNEALKVAAKNKYAIWCVEIGEYAAQDLYKTATDKIFYGYMKNFNKTYGIEGYTAIPFFSSSEDSVMLQTAITQKMAIWGIDQESQMSFPYHLSKVFNDLSLALKVQNKSLLDSLMKKWYFPKEELLDSLSKLSKDKENMTRLEEVKLSEDIYANYGEDRFQMNSDRAKLMKKHFYSYLKTSEKQNPQALKIFFKMGSNHLAKGFNLETHQLDMGNLAHELAIMKGSSYTNVQFIQRLSKNNKGVVVDEMLQKTSEYSKFFMAHSQKDKWVVIDLKPLRAALKHDKTLDEVTYEIIEKYDTIILSPEIN